MLKASDKGSRHCAGKSFPQKGNDTLLKGKKKNRIKPRLRNVMKAGP